MQLIKRKGECRVAILPGGVCVLFSYETAVAVHIGTTVYRTTTRHSRTSLIHVNRWVRDMKAYFPEDIRRVRRLDQKTLENLISTEMKGSN